MGIGRFPVNNKLEVQGSASKSSAGSWTANSDARLKEKIIKLDSKAMLEKVLAMRGVSFLWDDDVTGYDRPEGGQIGFIAQDLQQVWPDKVSKETAYGDFDPVFVEAIKALAEENEVLRRRVSELEKLEERIAQLERQ